MDILANFSAGWQNRRLKEITIAVIKKQSLKIYIAVCL
jgi:hypothetical protein